MKRFFDILVSLTSLLLFSPVIIFLALMVRMKLGSPLLFKQARPGLHAKIFNVYKFRTMTDETDDKGQLLSDEIRLTPFGKFLRKFSLDELPQLVNVIKGDMSLVGPRPLLIEYLPRYSQEQARRHDIMPGITGWAQVNGRNNLPWEEKFELDIWYIDHMSFWLDVKILWLTMLILIKAKDVQQRGYSTAAKFFGNKYSHR